jgi:hypothetical protein
MSVTQQSMTAAIEAYRILPKGERTAWSREYQRKCLQNDELVDYALCRSDLFLPSRAERVISAEPP